MRTCVSRYDSHRPNGLPLHSLQRSSPSSEMVMIDRTFNQEERSNLTQDKRMVLVDPGKKKIKKNGAIDFLTDSFY